MYSGENVSVEIGKVGDITGSESLAKNESRKYSAKKAIMTANENGS